MIKKKGRSRTLWINGIAVVVFAIGLILDQAGILQIPPAAVAVLGVIVGTLNYVLRLLTGEALAGTPAASRVALYLAAERGEAYREGRQDAASSPLPMSQGDTVPRGRYPWGSSGG